MKTKRKLNPQEWEPWSSRQRMSPFPNYLSMEAVCGIMRKFVGISVPELIIFFDGNVMTMPRKRADADHVGEFLLRRVQQTPTLYRQLIQLQRQYGAQLVSYARQAGRAATSASPKALNRLYAGYEPRYKPVYATYGSVWSIEDYLQRRLTEIIQQKVGEDSQQVAAVYDSLTKQPSAMVGRIERQALLTIAVAALGRPAWRNALASGEIAAIEAITPLARAVTKHVNTYFWVTRDYEDPALTVNDVVRRLRELLTGDVRAEARALSKKARDEGKLRTQHQRQYRFSVQERQLFATMRDAAHLKELRKRYVSASLHYFDPVLEVMAKQLGLTMRQVRFMRTTDIADALLRGRRMQKELDDRIAFSAWHVVGSQESKVIIGKPARDLYQSIFSVDQSAREFKGMAASPGKARGPARIVMNPDECGKVREGDIIVSVQVVPSFCTAIMKAAGLVCDGGHGITSHPATLAREAGIPCVIQTKHVREVVKDGDLLEVDGTVGVVRKI